ncbi:BlaI/MecI/CopY family transcriptional regulator [Roseateles sp. DAIF2]|uniref:BlaI/MecI/CopY family transcriptional regulator n=1 Tax=Roseateles sp. DAIF2 TaxID=2714952 RepID=UPI0018A25CCA|nr:BlaI/MecI/CopY family transcriptional regulator [Roseateles sp. DAIF2]QPF74091.1 BlaI/MecI/CopY family transcriptional regulator [Roseateles sp. DAIF2]
MSTAASPKPTAAELDLLRILWRHGPCSARQAHEALRLDRPEISEANVLRQLQLMHGKGLLTRDEGQRPHVYAAAQAQDKLQSQLLKDMAFKLFGGSGKALIMAALRTQVSAQERDEIAQLLQQGEHGDKPGKGRRS